MNNIFKIKCLVLLIAFLTTSCSENSMESQPQGLAGSWEWLKSSGGFAGWTLTPDSNGYNLYYEFNKDSTVSKWQNDSLIFQSAYHLDGNILTIEEEDIEQEWEITGDSLILFDQCIDCYVHIYKRGDRSKPQILIRDDLNSIKEKDPLDIQNVRINGDDISLTVSYSGGCIDHRFVLFASSLFMESFPVQAALYLSHEDHNDPCDAIITKTIHFNLSRLKEAYQKSYGQGGSMYLRIGADGNDTHYEPMPLYEF